MKQIGLIFGMQRCGSNFFLSACRRFEDLTVYGEMFHRGGVYPFQLSQARDFETMQRLAQFIYREFPDQTARALGGWDFQAPWSAELDTRLSRYLAHFAHADPLRYFRAIVETAPHDRLLLKIFPEHLSISQILSILYEQRPRVILMIRNPLESFISFKKLTETEKPQDVETSHLKITFNKAEYYEYKAQLLAYFTSIKEFCADEKIPVDLVSYEALHAADGVEKTEKVRRILETIFATPVTARADAALINLFSQQDKSSSTADKVNNPGRLPRTAQFLFENAQSLKAPLDTGIIEPA